MPSAGFMIGFSNQIVKDIEAKEEQKRKEEMFKKEQAFAINQEALQQWRKRRSDVEAQTNAVASQGQYLIARGASVDTVNALAAAGPEALASFRTFVETAEEKAGRNLEGQEIDASLKIYETNVPKGMSFDQFLATRTQEEYQLDLPTFDMLELDNSFLEAAYAPVSSAYSTQFAINQDFIPNALSLEDQKRIQDIATPRVAGALEVARKQLETDRSNVSGQVLDAATSEEFRQRSERIQTATALLDKGDSFGAAAEISPEVIADIAAEEPLMFQSTAISPEIRGQAYNELLKRGVDFNAYNVPDEIKAVAAEQKIIEQQNNLRQEVAKAATDEEKLAIIQEYIDAGGAGYLPPEFQSLIE